MPIWLLPLLVVGGGYAIWQAARAGAFGLGALELAAGKPDALTILNFPPFSITPPPRSGSVAYLAASGLSEGAMREALLAEVENVQTVRVVRANIPIPPPTGTGPAAYADLWAVTSTSVGDPQETITISPKFLVDSFVNDATAGGLAVQFGIDPTATNVDPSRVLAALLYLIALRPATDPSRNMFLVPVAATQA